MRTRSPQTLGSLRLHTRCVDEAPVTPGPASVLCRARSGRTHVRAHLAAGRLAVDEFSERVERTFRATGVDDDTLKCARHDSNMRPLPPQGSALSPELRALGAPSVAAPLRSAERRTGALPHG